MVIDFIKSIPENLRDSFKGKNLLWHMLAILVTAFIVYSGFDWYYFLLVRNDLLNTVFFPALPLGMIFPIVLPLTLIIFSTLFKRKMSSVFGWALLSSATVSWLVSVFYKALTGRVQPNVSALADGINQSFNWNFGFLEHGVFWGWPSSHTTVAFAMTATLVVLLKGKKPALKWLAILYAFYIGIAISLRIHWFSEFVAGAIIGTLVGVVVGKWWKSWL